jgi:hypothetical protein
VFSLNEYLDGNNAPARSGSRKVIRACPSELISGESVPHLIEFRPTFDKAADEERAEVL